MGKSHSRDKSLGPIQTRNLSEEHTEEINNKRRKEGRGSSRDASLCHFQIMEYAANRPDSDCDAMTSETDVTLGIAPSKEVLRRNILRRSIEHNLSHFYDGAETQIRNTSLLPLDSAFNPIQTPVLRPLHQHLVTKAMWCPKNAVVLELASPLTCAQGWSSASVGSPLRRPCSSKDIFIRALTSGTQDRWSEERSHYPQTSWPLSGHSHFSGSREVKRPLGGRPF